MHVKPSDNVSQQETTPTITVKQKNPGRVAAGKRLAELSRKRREVAASKAKGVKQTLVLTAHGSKVIA